MFHLKTCNFVFINPVMGTTGKTYELKKAPAVETTTKKNQVKVADIRSQDDKKREEESSYHDRSK